MADPARDPLTLAANSLKWEIVSTALLIVALYFIRVSVLEARDELQEARKQRSHLELELEKKEEQLDGALAHISKINGSGDAEPAGG